MHLKAFGSSISLNVIQTKKIVLILSSKRFKMLIVNEQVAIKMEAIRSDQEESSLSSTDLRPRSFVQVWRDWLLAILKYFWKKIHSPLGVYLIFTWIISIVIMGYTNTLRGEGEEYSFGNGPSYWMKVFLTYGLNTGQDPTLRFIAKPGIVWFFAPMVAILLGFSLFILTDSGFLRNGFSVVDEIDFAQNHRYYNMDDIWGSELINPSRPKWTLMYIWIVLMPVFLGATLTGTYNFIVFKKIKKRSYLPSAKLLLFLVFIVSLVIGTAMALLTGDIELRFRDLLYSLFVERRSNDFLVYGFEYKESYGNQGQYHPIAVGLTMMLIYFIPFLITYGIFLIIGNLDNIWNNKDYVYRRIANAIEARRSPELDFKEVPGEQLQK